MSVLPVLYYYAMMPDMEKETSKNEILEAINEFSNRVDEKFVKVDERLDKIKSTMVTKDYLDDKLADLRGDLVVLMRKEDTKMIKLVEILKRRAIITEAEEKEILSMEQFAKLYA